MYAIEPNDERLNGVVMALLSRKAAAGESEGRDEWFACGEGSGPMAGVAGCADLDDDEDDDDDDLFDDDDDDDDFDDDFDDDDDEDDDDDL